MPPLPAHLIHHADQAKAEVDAQLTVKVNELRKALDEHDSTYLWWMISHRCMSGPLPDMATTLASALLRLAQAN
jgi:hypothetical protein